LISRSPRLRQLAALLVALNGAFGILSAWLVHHPARFTLLAHHLPVPLLRGSWLTGVLAGAVQLFLAWSLSRRKWQAWRIVVVVLLFSAGAQLLRELHYGQAAFSLGLLLLLLVLKPQFTAASDPPSVRHGALVFLGAALFTYLYGLLGFYLLDRHFHQNFNLLDASRQTLAFLAWLDTPALARPNLLARWFLDSLAVIEAGGLAYGLVMVLQPVVYRRTVLAAERERARGILERHGRSSLAHLTLLPDKTYFFSRSGQSFAAYTLVGNVAVALGDPVGPEEDIPRLISEFRDTCGENDWYPVFYQTLPDHLPGYHTAGFKSLKIGEEAVVELAGFSLAGSRRKSLRQSVGRMTRLGYTTELLEPPLGDDTLARLKEVSDQWLRLQTGGEKRFSLGWFDPSYLKPCPVMVVLDATGRFQAFANLIPEYRRNEGTIDLMRRRSAENGLMDMLFIRLIEHFRERGYETFNLGLCPLAGVGDEPGAGLQERAARFFYQHFNRLYSFKGLRRFKEKFDPCWEPRYLIYNSALALPKIAVAVVRANAGGSLLTYAGAWLEKVKSRRAASTRLLKS